MCEPRKLKISPAASDSAKTATEITSRFGPGSVMTHLPGEGAVWAIFQDPDSQLPVTTHNNWPTRSYLPRA